MNATHILDIGSRGGLAKRWNRVTDQIRVTAVDADEPADGPPPPYPVEYRKAALSGNARDATLFVTRKTECSSLLRPNRALLDYYPDSARFDIVNEIPMRTQTATSLGIAPDFIKIDVQGLGLDVLRGAPLESVVGIEVEVEVIAIYEQQALFGAVDSFLTGCGFGLADIKRYYWQSNAGTWHLVFGDALYLRDRGGLAASQQSKLNVIEEAYGYHDRRPFVRGAGRLVRWLKPFTRQGWADADFTIGRR